MYVLKISYLWDQPRKCSKWHDQSTRLSSPHSMWFQDGRGRREKRWCGYRRKCGWSCSGRHRKKGGQRHTDVKIITTKNKTNSCFLLVPTLLIWINAYFGWLRIAWWSVPIDCCNQHSNMLTGKIAQVQDITQAALWDEMVDYCKYWHLSLLIICKSTEGVWQRTRGLVIQQASACT